MSTAIALGAVVLAGCASGPAPSPTPTAAFASADEAYAAAEKVYRAYNDAGNLARSSDSEAKPQEFLVGQALEGYLEGQDYLRRNGVRLVGESVVLSFRGESFEHDRASSTIVALVCFDVSGTRVLRGDGEDVTPPSHPGVLAQRVTFEGSKGDLLIAAEDEGEAKTCSHE